MCPALAFLQRALLADEVGLGKTIEEGSSPSSGTYFVGLIVLADQAEVG